MKEQLLQLLELQKIDERVLELRRSIEALPAKLEPARADLAKLEAMVEMEKQRIAETEAWRKQQEDLIKTDEEALQKARSKVQQAKNTKDFSAANREVENKRRAISAREDEVLKVIEAMEASKQQAEAHENDVNALRDKLAGEETKITERMGELEAEAREAASGRDEVAAGIDKQLLKRYEYTLKRRGVAIAPVVDGVCRGCHMQILPQLNNILARGESIETCPRCQRMMYRADWLAEQVGDGDGEGTGDGDGDASSTG